MKSQIQRNLILSLTLLVCFLGLNKANATRIHTFEGETIAFGFDWTVTDSDPFLGFTRGEERRGSYSYKSATIDGTFSLGDGTLELDGVLDENPHSGGPPTATLVVEGGTVKAFDYIVVGPEESARYDPIRGGSYDFDSLIFASFTITDPKRVPETGSTVLLLGAGLLGLAVIRRKMIRRN